MNSTSAQRQNGLPATVAQAPMNAHRVIRVAGPDAADLLQGQVSSNIHALEQDGAQLSSYNSPKGRVLAFLRVLKHGENYWLVVDAEIAEAFLQRLKMFVLRAKVTIEFDDALSGTVLAGPRAEELLAASGWRVPASGTGEVHADSVLLALPGPVPRVEIFGPSATLPRFEAEQATASDLARWDVLFRVPRINEANRDRHVAQHLDLDELGAISFKKGCYTGQEIIARMKYLGKVKKRTRVFTGSGAKPGDSVRTDDDRNAGDIVNVAAAGDGQLILASVNLDAAAPLRVNDSVITPL